MKSGETGNGESLSQRQTFQTGRKRGVETRRGGICPEAGKRKGLATLLALTSPFARLQVALLCLAATPTTEPKDLRYLNLAIGLLKGTVIYSKIGG